MKSGKGTAGMSPEVRQEVARKGGLAISANKEHMAAIGRKGGQAISRDRDHMSRIGQVGGSKQRLK